MVGIGSNEGRVIEQSTSDRELGREQVQHWTTSGCWGAAAATCCFSTIRSRCCAPRRVVDFVSCLARCLRPLALVCLRTRALYWPRLHAAEVRTAVSLAR